MSITVTETLSAAMKALAALDGDHARERNKEGFSQADTHIGHALAEIPESEWGVEEGWTAYCLARTYQGQLRGLGIEFAEIEAPTKPAIDERDAREITRGIAYEHRVAKRRKSIFPTISLVAAGFKVEFEYKPELVAGVKEIDGRRYDAGGKFWTVPAKGAAGLALYAEKFGAAMDTETARILSECEEAAIEEAKKPPKRMELTGEKITVISPYDAALVSELKAIGGRWNGEVWQVSTGQIAKTIEIGKRYGFWLQPELEVAADALVTMLAEKVEASRSLSAELEIPGIREGLTLHPFQKAGIRYLLDHADGRGMIGDEMGLGKTPQTMCTVEAADAFPCLVVVPNLVKLNWLREIDLWLPGRSITMLEAKADRRVVKFRRHAIAGGGNRVITTNDMRAEFMVVNYDILKKVLPRFVGRQLGAVIYDEAHYLKNEKAQRTVAAKAIASISKLRLMATGTAILNRPIELLSPLEILGRASDLGGRSFYQRRYCDGHRDSRGHWDVSGASNLGELNEKLRQVCYVRRDKADVLTELPPVQRQSIMLPISNRAEYRKAEKDVVDWARGQAEADRGFLKSLAGLDKAEREKAIRERGADASRRAESAEALRRMGALRKLTGEGKIAAVKEWTAEFMEQGEKLILFTWHVDVQKALIAEFPGCARVLADDAPQDRDREVARFQEDPDCKLIVISLNVGGVGLTITAAHHLAFVELPWRPGDVDQAEGRAYGRLNDAHGLSSYYLLGEDTFDLDMAELIDTKRAVTDAVNSGKEGASGDSIMTALVGRMAARAEEEVAA